jgi:regulator of cell morphogenesis and NO signaling
MDRTQTVRDIVVGDYRTADVFKKWGINYCCGGNLPFEEACNLKQINKSDLEKDLEQATRNVQVPNTIAFDQWPVEFLTDYIVHVHHSYLKTTTQALLPLVESFVNSHIKKYPYLPDVKEILRNLCSELEEHTAKEEESIFPYVKQISNTFNRKETYGSLFVRTMSKPLAEVIDKEHNRIASLLQQLREKTNNYTFSSEACANHQVIYRKLKAFDADLVQHKHLENNILFPKVLEMEKALLYI